MLHLLLPALMPSWRFFDRIGPAPRIEFALGRTADEAGATWQDVRPAPRRLPPRAMIVRLIWNPRWNEVLYLVSCAERLLDEPSPERAAALWTRVADIVRTDRPVAGATGAVFLRVRIVEAMRERGRIVHRVMFVSDARRLDGDLETSYR